LTTQRSEAKQTNNNRVNNNQMAGEENDNTNKKGERANNFGPHRMMYDVVCRAG
jgi:hypothetical protein